MIVDTHTHIARDWYEPAEVLLAQMDRCGVDRAWLVQLLGVYDNDYLQASAAAHRDRFDCIVQVDWTRPNAVRDLEVLAGEGARGVRLRPESRSPGDDAMGVWRAATRLGLVVSCVGTAAQFTAPAFAGVLAELPDLPVVLEHLGGLARPDAGDVAAAKVDVFRLARFANVRLKLPGLGQLQPRAALARQPLAAGDPRGALVGEAIAAFGDDRLLWGSDFPVVASREGYANALAWLRSVVPGDSVDRVFGGTAAALIPH